MKATTPMHKWFMDIGNLTVGQWDFNNISNDSFGADGSQNPATKPVATGGQLAVAANDAVKAKSGVDMGKESGSVMDKFIYLPYLGLGVGYAGAAYMGHRNKSTTWGYLGWMALGAVVGLGGGVALASALTKKQLDTVAGKLDAGTKSGSGTGASALAGKDGDIKASVDKLVDKMVKVAPKLVKDNPDAAKNMTPDNIAKGKAMIATQLPLVLAKLTDKEKGMAIDALKSVDVLVDKVSADADKGVKQDPMVLFGYLGQLQDDMTKKYSQKELDDFFDKLSSLMPKDAPMTKMTK